MQLKMLPHGIVATMDLLIHGTHSWPLVHQGNSSEAGTVQISYKLNAHRVMCVPKSTFTHTITAANTYECNAFT